MSSTTATSPPPESGPAPPLPSQKEGWNLIIVNIVFTILAIAAVSGRVWSRRLKDMPLGIDDWCLVAALVVWLGEVGYLVWSVSISYTLTSSAQDAVELELVAAKSMSQLFAILQFTYATEFFLVRLSICMLMIRIFLQKWLRKCVFVGVGINACWALFVIFCQVAICQPFAFNWDPTIPGGHCNNDIKLNLTIANAIWSILYDSGILLLPQSIIWRLQMPRTTKALLSAIFLLGVVDITISIIRIIFVVHVNFSDPTGSFYLPQMWTVLEQSIALIVACLPPTRPAFEKAFPCIPGLAKSIGSHVSSVRDRGFYRQGKEKQAENTLQLSDRGTTPLVRGQQKGHGASAYRTLTDEDIEMKSLGGNAKAAASLYQRQDLEAGIRMQRDVTVMQTRT